MSPGQGIVIHDRNWFGNGAEPPWTQGSSQQLVERDAYSVAVRPLRPSMIAVVATLTVSSCGGGDDRTCTLMAWYSGVDVEVESNDWHVQGFCLDGNCDDPNSVVTEAPSTYKYRLLLRSSEGELVEHTGTVATRPYFPNGEGCEPETANAVIEVDRNGKVSTRPLG